ncbi:MAG: response regulator [Desulfobacteraceae bacterium]|nr:response regulator [Desulfobacteraceae bacterium]
MDLEALKAENTKIAEKCSQISIVSFSEVVDNSIIDDIILDWGNAAQRLENTSLQLEANPDDSQALVTIKKTLHTLKSDCGIFGLYKASDIFQQVESLLEQYIESDACPSDMLLAVVDWLRKIIGKIGAGDFEVKTRPSPVNESEKSSMKTLIMDDDFTNRLLLQDLLKEYGPVHISVNGKEAVTAVIAAMEDKESYDLVCLDIMMPEMDGQEALKLIREKEKRAGVTGRGIKILMITALSDGLNVIKSFKEQCDGYLVKPITKANLLEQLYKLCLIGKKDPG